METSEKVKVKDFSENLSNKSILNKERIEALTSKWSMKEFITRARILDYLHTKKRNRAVWTAHYYRLFAVSAGCLYLLYVG